MGIRAESMIQAAQMVLEEGEGLINKSDVNKIEKLILAIKTTLYKGEYKDTRAKIDELKEFVEVFYNKLKQKARMAENSHVKVGGN